jgi:hypothetical protein
MGSSTRERESKTARKQANRAKEKRQAARHCSGGQEGRNERRRREWSYTSATATRARYLATTSRSKQPRRQKLAVGQIIPSYTAPYLPTPAQPSLSLSLSLSLFLSFSLSRNGDRIHCVPSVRCCCLWCRRGGGGATDTLPVRQGFRVIHLLGVTMILMCSYLDSQPIPVVYSIGNCQSS